MKIFHFFALSALFSAFFVFVQDVEAGTKKLKLRVTNTTARKLKITWGCKSNGKISKLGSKNFPGSKGETKSFSADCSSLYIKIKAKIMFSWKKVRVYYSESLGTLPSKNAITYTSSTSSKSYVYYLYLGARNSEDRICLYVYESGIVKAFPRQCP